MYNITFSVQEKIITSNTPNQLCPNILLLDVFGCIWMVDDLLLMINDFMRDCIFMI